MSINSRNESTLSSERIFTTNLKLLGFASDDKDVIVCPEMFEHSNPKAFQQIFHFLLTSLDKDRAKTEFRDCWPALDKKQEAEFRKKVSNWIKELQREHQNILPYTNPALFQSPGGRKFVQFLRIFTTFVMKHRMEKEGQYILSKPTSKQKSVQKLMFGHLIDSTKDNLTKSVEAQEGISQIINQSTQSAETLSQKYFNIKARKEELAKEVKAKREKTMENYKGTEKNYDQIQEETFQNFTELSQRLQTMQEIVGKCEELSENVISVTDRNVCRPTLDFTKLNKDLVNEADILMTYENLLKLGNLSYKRCLDLPARNHWNSFKENAVTEHSENLEVQSSTLREMKPVLSKLKEELSQSVDQLSKQADQVDWSTAFLGSNLVLNQDQVFLPPTPVNTKAFPMLSPEIIANLKLLTPSDKSAELKTRSGGHRFLQIPGDTPTGPVVNRKFSRKITPDHSPLLRVSLIQSHMRRTSTTEDSVSSQVSETREGVSKASLDCFSPELCSTRLKRDDAKAEEADRSSLKIPEMVMDKVEMEEKVELDVTMQTATQTKIEMYRRVLQTVNSKIPRKVQEKEPSEFRVPDHPKDTTPHKAHSGPHSTGEQQNVHPGREDATDLLGVWTQVRQHISPKTSPVERSKSRMSKLSLTPLDISDTSPFLQKKKAIASFQNGDVTTRLDALMDSLTLSDSSLDMTLGRLSLSEDLMLSPHCP